MSEAPIRVWRIVRASLYVDDAFVTDLPEDRKAWSGGFAAKFPQRWNIVGHPVAYTSESRALAAWEVFIQADVAELISPNKFRLVSATIDVGLLGTNAIVDAPPGDQLPAGWAGRVSMSRDAPPSPSQVLGNRLLIEWNALAIRIPSVIIPGEFNYVINVKHSAFEKLTFSSPEPFDFDDRIQRLGA